MNDTTEFWKLVGSESSNRRAKNRNHADSTLRRLGVVFESKNEGAHLIIGTARKIDERIDFWPGTGRWITRIDRKKHFGLDSLLKYMGHK